jgi:hypothetical protein
MICFLNKCDGPYKSEIIVLSQLQNTEKYIYGLPVLIHGSMPTIRHHTLSSVKRASTVYLGRSQGLSSGLAGQRYRKRGSRVVVYGRFGIFAH